MGLVKAALGAASGVMGDQWKEYFYCSALPAEVLAVKGQKKVSGRSSNRHGAENIITDGSIVAVAEGQCALIVEQGKVVDLCAEPGEYTYSTGTQPSLLSGGLKDIDGVFAEMGKRFGFGGQAAAAQREKIYTYGIWFKATGPNSITDGFKYSTILSRRAKTSKLVEFGDSEPNPDNGTAGLSSDVTALIQAGKYWGAGKRDGWYPVAVRHSLRGNLSMFDGHVESRQWGELQSDLITYWCPMYAYNRWWTDRVMQ